MTASSSITRLNFTVLMHDLENSVGKNSPKVRDIAMTAVPEPPKADCRPVTITYHGRDRIDNYAWLKDANWQEVMRDPSKLKEEIRAYLEAENSHTQLALSGTKQLQATLIKEMRGRLEEDEASVPAKDGAYEYSTRFETGGQHPIFCRRRGQSSSEEVLLHGDKEAEGRSYFKIGGYAHSTDHLRLAYAVDLNGSERFQVRVRDLITGRDFSTKIEDAKGDVAWANDGKTLFYTLLDDNHRPFRVMRHTVDMEQKRDDLIYEEADPGFFVSLDKSQSGQYIIISAYDHTTSEIYLIDANNPSSPPEIVTPRKVGIEYSVVQIGEKLLILTNADDAEDFKIVETPLSNPNRENWKDVVPHEPGRLIRTILEFSNHLIRLERVDGLPRIIIRDIISGAEHTVEFDEEVYELNVLPGYEFDTTTLRFTYSSMTTPLRTYDYNMVNRSRELRKEQVVPSGHRSEDYVTRRLMAPSHDGALVPVSLLYHKKTPLDGTAPVLLYGYGSYGLAMPASFTTNVFSMVERGFIYAIAHIRGGTEKGYGWYLEGKLNKKENTFLDFIASAEHLISKNFTSAGRIAIHGGSAGGLLIGTCANLRPDLWGAVVGEVPFVDVLTTMCDAELPLTPPEWPEWGNPIEDVDAYDYIHSYSPIENVKEQAYPPILATAGLTDPRVTYWEPAKWIAKLRATKTDKKPLYLRTNMEAGHAGAAGRFDRLEEKALIYAFLLEVMGFNPRPNV